jgi:glycine betaine/proline transport system substrate-binding protein
MLMFIMVLLLTLTACTPTTPPPATDDTIVLGRATWETGWFQAEVFTRLLEELGYTVQDPDPAALEELGYTLDDQGALDPEAFYHATANGIIDMWPNGWFPLHNTYLEDAPVQGKVELVGYQVRAGALQGYLIDKATADEHDLTNLADLQDPAVAALFDSDDNGKADLIGCNSGWGCALTIEHHLQAYDLEETVEQVQGDYDALMTETLARYEEGDPILFYTWTPNWTIGKLSPGKDVVWIEVPFASLPREQHELEELTTLDGLDGCVTDPCNIGWPPNDIRVAANDTTLTSNPQLRRLLELVEIPLDDISRQNASMFDGENSAADIERHAEEWIAENREQVDAWLAEAQAAAE